MKFSSFNLKTKLVAALDELGYKNASAIQEIVIPKALKGKSLIVKSMTGSGKSHCFIIPILNNLKLDNKNAQSIIISPTRELARQTYLFFKQFEPYFEGLNVKLLIGGHQQKDDEVLKNNPPHIIIATPKRANDILVLESFIKLGCVKSVVLDEVDMMMDMGYFNDIDQLLKRLKDIQIMSFSASYPNKVIHLLKKYMPVDEIISLDDNITNDNVTHFAIDIKHQDKNEMVYKFINKFNPYGLIIFCSLKSDVNVVYNYLIEHKIKCGMLHGDLSQRERKNMMKMFKNNDFHIMVCSDMASRGLDLDNISDVLNYDLPNNEEFYFHRAGRVGRMNKKGNCYSFYNVDSVDKITNLEKNKITFTYLVYKNNDFISSLKVKKERKNNRLDPEIVELNKNIKIAKSKATTKKVKPNYKKKVKVAINEVKRKYKKEKIKKEIKKQLKKKYQQGDF